MTPYEAYMDFTQPPREPKRSPRQWAELFQSQAFQVAWGLIRQTLPARLSRLIEARYGDLPDRLITLRAIAASENVSPARIRQLEQKALRLMMRPRTRHIVSRHSYSDGLDALLVCIPQSVAERKYLLQLMEAGL